MLTRPAAVALAFGVLAGVAGNALAQVQGRATLENLLGSPAAAPAKPSDPSGKIEKLPMPDKSAVDEATDLIQQAFEDDLKNGATNPEPVILKFLSAAEKTEDAARRYALLLQSEALAVDTGNHSRALQVAEIRVRQFDIDAFQSRLDVLGKFMTVKGRSNPESLSAVFAHAISLAQRALDDGNPSDAKAAVSLAVGAAKAMQTAGRIKKLPEVARLGETKLSEAQELLKMIQRREGAVGEYKAALDVLGVSPGDVRANRLVGRYLCFIADNWEEGLIYLSKGDDEELKDLALGDLAAHAEEPRNPRSVFTIAGKWWKVAELRGGDDEGASAMKSRSSILYASVEKEIKDPLDSALARKRGTADESNARRLGDAAPRTGKDSSRSSTSPLNAFAGIDRALRAQSIRKTDIVGGVDYGTEFTDLPPKSGYVVGLKVSTGKFGSGFRYEAVGSIQPVYRTSDGIVAGQVHGPVNGKVTEIMAKDGYAISGLALNAPGRMHGLQVMFAKVRGDHLDLRDNYKSEAYLDVPAGSPTLGQDGQFVIGLRGWWAKEEVRGVGLIVLP